MVTTASPAHVDGFLALAAGVEDWFGPMVDDPGFHDALHRNIRRGSAYVVPGRGESISGGLLVGGTAPTYRIGWLVVAPAARGRGVGRALLDHAIGGFQRPCRVDVLVFGADHPAARDSGAREFYERLGFAPGDEAPRGPDGGIRQRFHLTLTT